MKGKVFSFLGAGILVLVLAAVIFVLTFDINSYRPRIETVASEATGLDVRINGKMGLSFFPLGISAKDVRVLGSTGEVLSLEDLRLGLELMPLLKKQLRVARCELVKPAITVVKDAEGRYNFEGSGRKLKKEAQGAALSLSDLRLFKGSLVYFDRKTGKKTEFKDLNLTVKDLSISDISGDISRNASFSGSLDCREVLQKDLRIENLNASVEAANGTYKFEPLVVGSLAYFGATAGEKTELKGIRLIIKDLSAADTPGDIIKNVTFTGTLECKEAQKNKMKIDGVKSRLKVDAGIIYLTPLTMDIFGAKAEGEVTADESKDNPVYKINMRISKLDFERLQESFSTKKVIGGKGDLSFSLTLQEKKGRNLMGGINGTFSVRGDNLIIYIMDLDGLLSSYETSQQFNLVDLGAYFIAGPLSTVAIKGYRYGDVYSHTRGGRSVISKLISHWKIRNGVAEATDCAFATRRNRVALKGRLNLISERYEDVVVALLDDKGCAKFKQGISGPFDNPKIGAVSAIESLAGPIADLYKKVKRFVEAGKCEVFYSGSVQQPK